MQLSLSSFPQISSYDPYCGLWGCQNVWTGCDLSSFMTLTLPRQGVAVLVLPLHFQSLSGLPDSSSSSSSSRSECSSSSSITKASSSTPVSSASSRAWVQLNTWYAGGHPCLHHTFSLAHLEDFIVDNAVAYQLCTLALLVVYSHSPGQRPEAFSATSSIHIQQLYTFIRLRPLCAATR
jgi:hypothetical protein